MLFRSVAFVVSTIVALFAILFTSRYSAAIREGVVVGVDGVVSSSGGGSAVMSIPWERAILAISSPMDLATSISAKASWMVTTAWTRLEWVGRGVGVDGGVGAGAAVGVGSGWAQAASSPKAMSTMVSQRNRTGAW